MCKYVHHYFIGMFRIVMNNKKLKSQIGIIRGGIDKKEINGFDSSDILFVIYNPKQTKKLSKNWFQSYEVFGSYLMFKNHFRMVITGETKYKRIFPCVVLAAF